MAGELELAFLCRQHSAEHGAWRTSPGKLRGRKGGEHNRGPLANLWPEGPAWCGAQCFTQVKRDLGSPPFLSEEMECWGLKFVQDHSACKGQWQGEHPGCVILMGRGPTCYTTGPLCRVFALYMSSAEGGGVSLVCRGGCVLGGR